LPHLKFKEYSVKTPAPQKKMNYTGSKRRGIISEEYDVNRPGTHSAVDRSFYDTIILLDFSNETVWAKNKQDWTVYFLPQKTRK